MNVGELSERLSSQVESVTAMLLPNGKRSGPHWVAGSVNGEEGESLKVTITGRYAGNWRDFATDEHGDLIDLWAATRRLSLAETLNEVRDHLGIQREPIKRAAPPPKPAIGKLQGVTAIKPGPAMEYLTGERKIPEAVLKPYRVSQKGSEVVFPSLSESGERLNVKYLGKGKKIRCEKGGIPTLFGWQAIPENTRRLVITEGEIDALSVAAQGIPAVSVPFGAGNHQWIETDWERLERFDDIVLWFDTDEPGQKGAKEVSQRLGIERCRIAKATTGKDANAMLQAGDHRHREAVEKAEGVRHPTIRSVEDCRGDLMDALYPPGGVQPGFDLGWDGMDWLRFRPSELVVVSGINGHGKSQMVGQICLQAMSNDLKCCIASMELPIGETLARLSRQAGATDELTREYAGAISEWMGGRLWLYDRLGTTKLDEMLDGFDYARKRYGVQVFVIDSLMMLGLAKDDHAGEKEVMTRLMEWKLDTGATVLLVTHSKKSDSETRKPGKFDVAGAAEITNMGDTVLVVWRDKREEREWDGVLYCFKQRNTGREGSRAFRFDTRCDQFLPSRVIGPHRYVPFTRAAA